MANKKKKERRPNKKGKKEGQTITEVPIVLIGLGLIESEVKRLKKVATRVKKPKETATRARRLGKTITMGVKRLESLSLHAFLLLLVFLLLLAFWPLNKLFF